MFLPHFCILPEIQRSRVGEFPQDRESGSPSLNCGYFHFSDLWVHMHAYGFFKTVFKSSECPTDLVFAAFYQEHCHETLNFITLSKNQIKATDSLCLSFYQPDIMTTNQEAGAANILANGDKESCAPQSLMTNHPHL